MQGTSPVIALTTRTLDSHSGTSQVALDLLLALGSHARQLIVNAWVPRAPPRSLDGRPLGPIRLAALSPSVLLRGLVSGEAPPRGLLEHMRLLTRRAEPLPAAAIEIVNGIGAHALHAALRAHQPSNAPAALLVQESPRHFERAARGDLPGAIAALRSYEYCVFVSDRGRAEWSRLAELDASRAFYIPNCVREQRAEALLATPRPAAEGGEAELRIVCVGTISARKGQDIVLRALRELSGGGPRVRVDFLGGHGSPFATRLMAQVRASDLAARVRFLGRTEDVYDRVYAADALVLASRAEAFPLCVLEAMALGTCVIAADVDGVSEQVVHGQTGLLFAPEDATGLAKQLRKIAAEPALRARLGQSGRARYLQEFRRDRQLERWGEVLSRMLG